MNNSTQTELLIRFLDNELPDAERTQVEASLASDPSLAEEFERLRISRNLVQSFALRQQVNSIHTEMLQELRQESATIPLRRSPVRRLSRFAWPVAASILIILSVTVFYQYMTLTPQRIFEDNYSPYQEATSRGYEGSPLNALYREHKFQDLVRAFETSGTHTIEELFLAGNAYLELNQPVSAISMFQQIQASNTASGSTLFKDDAEYYLGMSYLKNGEATRAFPILQGIRNNPDHAYHDKVSAWELRKLKILLKQ
ncbi:MAG TPA: tetratricopeptide repeat protein [Flavitalea sp.]|nr:tetratricopeptide repeat protein [Flavitalea sp.]